MTGLPHLFPDVVVAEEATHLPFGESATGERVVVTRQQVHAQEFNVAAVQCAAHKHTEIHEMKSVTELFYLATLQKKTFTASRNRL